MAEDADPPAIGKSHAPCNELDAPKFMVESEHSLNFLEKSAWHDTVVAGTVVAAAALSLDRTKIRSRPGKDVEFGRINP